MTILLEVEGKRIKVLGEKANMVNFTVYSNPVLLSRINVAGIASSDFHEFVKSWFCLQLHTLGTECTAQDLNKCCS